jgi:hypothetical protein
MKSMPFLKKNNQFSIQNQSININYWSLTFSEFSISTKHLVKYLTGTVKKKDSSRIN